MAYITLIDLKRYLKSYAAYFADEELEDIIADVTYKINSRLASKVIRERVYYIDMSRPNILNGTNKTFYVRKWKWFLADYDDDGEVTASDVTVYQYNGTNPETILPVESVDASSGSFTLVDAPTNGYIFATYAYSYFDMATPDKNISTVAKYLALYECFFEIEQDVIGTSIKQGNLSTSGLDKNMKYHKWGNRAKEKMNDLLDYSTSKVAPQKFTRIKSIDYQYDPGYEYGEVLNYGHYGERMELYPYMI